MNGRVTAARAVITRYVLDRVYFDVTRVMSVTAPNMHRALDGGIHEQVSDVVYDAIADELL